MVRESLLCVARILHLCQMSKTLDDKRNVLASVATSLQRYPRLMRLATSLAQRFKPTVAATLEHTQKLAYWLYVYEQPALCLQVCQLLNDLEFEQDYNRWTWVELTLVLEWKLQLEAGHLVAAQACVEALQATYAVGDLSMQQINARALKNRLSGALLKDAEIAEAELFADKTTAMAYRLAQLGELLFIQCQEGFTELPLSELEQQITRQLIKLRDA
jgi:hypothetical protein